MKRCCKCKCYKSEFGFTKNRAMADGLSPSCRECKSKDGAKYYQDNRERLDKKNADWYKNHPGATALKTLKWRNKEGNKEKVSVKNKKFRKENPEQGRAKALMYNYGMSVGEFNQMSAEQKGVCAICKQVPGGKGLCVDHDHKTARVRGLLCFTCNMALGLLKDSVTYVRSAAEYLEKTYDAQTQIPDEQIERLRNSRASRKR